MTRINCGIPPAELTDKHLIAEHREIKRIPNTVSKYFSEGRLNMKDQPEHFKLGTGHVKFFYDKLGYLLTRYEQIYAECRLRKFNVTYYGDVWKNVPQHLMGNYTPTDMDREIVRERINERLSATKDYKNSR
jgi:deoxyribonuclease (pyrimidine dimer)